MKIICKKLIHKYLDIQNKLFLYVLMAVQAIKVYILNITLLIINVCRRMLQQCTVALRTVPPNCVGQMETCFIVASNFSISLTQLRRGHDCSHI